MVNSKFSWIMQQISYTECGEYIDETPQESHVSTYRYLCWMSFMLR